CHKRWRSFLLLNPCTTRALAHLLVPLAYGKLCQPPHESEDLWLLKNVMTVMMSSNLRGRQHVFYVVILKCLAPGRWPLRDTITVPTVLSARLIRWAPQI